VNEIAVVLGDDQGVMAGAKRIWQGNVVVGGAAQGNLRVA